MKQNLLLVMLLVFAASNCLASNLDRPVTQQPTVRSEILRGSTAVGWMTSCKSDPSVCAWKAIESARKMSTETEPFLLGIYLQSWLNTDIHIDSLKRYSSGVHAQAAIIDAQESAQDNYNQFRTLQHKLALTDEEVASAAKIKLQAIQERSVKYK